MKLLPKGAVRQGRGSLALIFAFLVVPYFVDVAWFGDFTPTHFAQENFIDEDIQFVVNVPSSAHDQNDGLGNENHPSTGAHSYQPSRLPAVSIFILQCLICASLLIRPPPTLSRVLGHTIS